MKTPHSNPSSDPAAPSTPAVNAPNRRWLLGASAVTAAALGIGVAWWRDHGAATPTGAPAPSPVSPVEGFWSMQWDNPKGGKVTMQSFQGHPLLVNFWATWCPPCVDELPLINDFYRRHKAAGWQVLGLAVDQLAPVQAFLQKMPLDFPVGLAGLSGTELGRGLGNTAGSLPFSVALSANGAILQRKIGRLTAADLDTWLSLK